MENYNNSKNKDLNIAIILNKIFKGIISIAIFLIALEVFLQISGFIYVRSKYRIKNPEISREDSLRIMFIGDSWTQGAEAAPQPGYVPLTMEKLNKLYPGKNIQGYNFAWGSTNSSQAIHQFLDNYYKVKPHIVVAMTGLNNGWNTQDIITARKRIRNELNNDSQKAVKFSEYIVNNFGKLKIVKLYNLIFYNIVYKPKEIKIPFPDDKYALSYHQIHSDTRDPEKARLYLINNYREKATDYNDFYKLTLHSFGGDINKTLDYLKNKNMLKLNLIRENINIKENERYRASNLEILEENLTDLKSFCDRENIIMVVENYPHTTARQFNIALSRIAKRLNIFYVDHYRYFEDNIGYEEWNKTMTMAHVNYKGHEYMSDNLTVILSNIIMNYGNT